MPTHADNHTYSQLFNEGQLAHYGLPTGGVPRSTASSSTGNRSPMPQRRPVYNDTPRRNQDSAYPSMSSIPTRKPVGSHHGSTSPAHSQSRSPAPAKRGGGPDLDKPLPSNPPGWVRGPDRRMHPSPPTSTQTTPLQADPRPGSSTGWSFRSRKRTDSHSSNATRASMGQRSRNGSFGSIGSIGEAAKNAGKWVQRRIEIVTMPEKEREALFAGQRQQQERENELRRQRGELPRPMHQKQYLAELSSGGKRVSTVLADATYQANQDHEVYRKKKAGSYQEMHKQAVQEAAWTGKPRPNTPPTARLSPPQRRDSLTPSMNQAAEERYNGGDPETRLYPTTTDYFMNRIGQVADTFFKRKDSDGSVWFSDAVPTDSMHHCAKCGRAPRKYLQKSMCEDCIRARYFDLQTTLGIARKKGHNPKSPEDDAKGGDLYIRLPTQNRLRKVRETIYLDPGNPFDVEDFAFPPLPSTAPQAPVLDTSWEIDNREMWPLADVEVAQTSSRADRDITSVISDPFDLATAHSNRETWSSFGSDQRSISVDIGFLPVQSMVEPQESSDLDPFSPLHVPILHVQHPSGTLFTMDTRRDTKFYDFYDDLLMEYGIEGSGIEMQHTQHMLPVGI